MGASMSAENTTRYGGPQGGEVEARRTRTVLLIAFVVALAIRAGAAWFVGSAQPQEVRYVTIARGILSGAGFHGLDNRFPDIIQPPLYPMMLSAALVLPGPDLGVARGLSVLMGALLVFPCAMITRRLFGERAARRTACLAAVYPLLADMSSVAITESTFAILVTIAALVTWRALEGEDVRFRPGPAAAAGLLLGLAFLTRPEGLTYLAATWMVCMADAVWRNASLASVVRHLKPVALSAAGFAAVVLPYLLWVHGQTGHWLLAPKGILVQVHQNLMQEGQRESWKEPFGSLMFYEHVKFGLNKDATSIRAHEEFSNASAGMAQGLLISDEEETSSLSPLMALRTVLRNFSELYLETVKYGFVIPSLLLMLAGIGLVSRPWLGEFRRGTIIVLLYLLGSFTFLVTHVEPRFLYTAVPFLLPWIAEGWHRSELWAAASFAQGTSRGAAIRRRCLRGAIGTVVIALTLIHLPPAVRITASLWAEHREMGLWLRDQAKPDQKVMAATAVVAYYAGTRFEVLPYADLEGLVRYARHKGVEYLVADRAEIPTYRPQLTSLLIPERPHPGLLLVRALHEGTPRAIFLYRIAHSAESVRN